MASNDPGLNLAGALGDDPQTGAVVEKKADGQHVEVEREPEVVAGQSDLKFETNRLEIWSYYSYYIGNNGLSLFNYAPTQFQNLMYLQAGDANYLYFAGTYRTIESIVLLSNGISFAIQIVVFLVLGSYADFGNWRPNILIVLSLIAWGIGFGWLGVYKPGQWQTAVGLYIVGLIAYQTCLAYWTAAFPGLARDTKEVREKAAEAERGECTEDELQTVAEMMRARLSNVSFYIQSVVEVVILAILVGILFGVHADRSDEDNSWSLSVSVAYTTAVWVVVAIPWFIFEKRRPGLDPGMNIVIAGFWQLWRAITQVWRLRQSLYYLIGYFLLGDSLNTTVTEVATLQASIIAYSSTKQAYLLIVGIAAQAAGIGAFWLIQKRFKFSSKTMFNAIAIGIVILDGWGMVGIWTQKFGFHNEWEFWLYQVYYGLFVCPWYSYSQIMISEVTPKGHEFLFFSLFSIMGKTSSFIGPIVSSAIIQASPTGNASLPFYFLFGLSLLSAVFLFIFVDIKKSKVEQAIFLKEEEAAKERIRRDSRGDISPPPSYDE